MAEWKELAKAVLLADGKIDDAEVKILKKYLWADKKIDAEELDFLNSLWIAANKKAKAAEASISPKFEKLYHDAIESFLKEGKLTPEKVETVKACLGKPSPGKTKFLTRLAKVVDSKIPEFTKLLETHGVKK